MACYFDETSAIRLAPKGVLYVKGRSSRNSCHDSAILRASEGLRVVCGLLGVGVHNEAPSFVLKEPVFAHFVTC